MKSLSIILSFLFSFILSQEKILFVGNSFTFYWNLPSLVNEMCNYTGDIVDIYQSTDFGSQTHNILKLKPDEQQNL